MLQCTITYSMRMEKKMITRDRCKLVVNDLQLVALVDTTGF